MNILKLYLVLIIIGIFLYTSYDEESAPPIVWNRTSSVPLGIYMRIPIYVIIKYVDLKKAIYVLLDPKSLLEGHATGKNFITLQKLVSKLDNHKVWVLKAIAEEDREYIRTFKRVPDEIKILSTHPRGIDYTFTGLLSSTLIEGFYIQLL